MVICEKCDGIQRKPKFNASGLTLSSNCYSFDAVQDDVRMANYIGRLEIACPRKCAWRGQVQEMYHHLRSCSNMSAKCPNQHCPEVFLAFNRDDHLSRCRWQLVTCPLHDELGCQKQLLRKDCVDHFKNESRTHLSKAVDLLAEKLIDKGCLKYYRTLKDLEQYKKIHKACGRCAGQLHRYCMSKRKPQHLGHQCDLCNHYSVSAYSLRCEPCDFDVCLLCDQGKKAMCLDCQDVSKHHTTLQLSNRWSR